MKAGLAKRKCSFAKSYMVFPPLKASVFLSIPKVFLLLHCLFPKQQGKSHVTCAEHMFFATLQFWLLQSSAFGGQHAKKGRALRRSALWSKCRGAARREAMIRNWMCVFPKAFNDPGLLILCSFRGDLPDFPGLAISRFDSSCWSSSFNTLPTCKVCPHSDAQNKTIEGPKRNFTKSLR